MPPEYPGSEDAPHQEDFSIPQNPPEQEPQPNTKPLVGKKRKILPKLAGAAVLGAAAFGAGYLEREREGKDMTSPVQLETVVPAVQQEYSTLCESLRVEYETTGELPPLDTRTELILAHDLIAYMDRDTSSKMLGVEVRIKYHALVAKVLQEAFAPQQKPEAPLAVLPKSHGLDVLLRLKVALQKNIGTTYNQESDTMVDPLVHGKYQCRSGTLSLVLMALEAQQQDRTLFAGGETLVEIYTEGHVEPGLLLKDRTLIALEMTSAGPSVRNFGNMDNIKQPMRVVLADHATYQDAIGAATLEGTILHDTVLKGTPTPQTPGKPNGKFGFGVPKVPEGDLPMQSVHILPAEGAFNPEDFVRRMEAPGNGWPMTDKERKFTDGEMKGLHGTPDKEEHINLDDLKNPPKPHESRVIDFGYFPQENNDHFLEEITDPQDKEYVKSSLIESFHVNKLFYSAVTIFAKMIDRIKSNENVSEGEIERAEEEIKTVAGRLEQYMQGKDLDGQYDQTCRIFERYKTRPVNMQKASSALGEMHSFHERLRRGWEEAANENK